MITILSSRSLIVCSKPAARLFSLLCRPFSRSPFPLLVVLALTCCGDFSLGAAQMGEQILFDGKNLDAWQKPTGEWQLVGAVALNPEDKKQFSITPGTGVMVNNPKGKTVNLISKVEHGDVEAHIEFVVPKDSNSGVYFQGRYEIQILDSYGVKELKYGDCGGVYASCSEPKPDFKGRAPSVNASKPPGEWQSFDVLFRAPRFDPGRGLSAFPVIALASVPRTISAPFAPAVKFTDFSLPL